MKQLECFYDARIGTALVSLANDLTLQDVYEFTDIFWIGGTKIGALLGEAVVVKDRNLARDFDFFIKQRGCLLAKSEIMGVQFARLFEDSLFFDLASAANTAASTLGKLIIDSGFQLLAEVEMDQVFVILPVSVVRALKQELKFYVRETFEERQSCYSIAYHLGNRFAETQTVLSSDSLDEHLVTCVDR